LSAFKLREAGRQVSAGAHLANDFEFDREFLNIFRPYRVSVASGARKWRKVTVCEDIFG
jgi:hypothetical protein